MNNVGINAHDIKEIRILRGKGSIDHLLRIVIVDGNDKTSDINLFGMRDKEIRKDITIPVKITNDIQVTTHEISFLGDVIDEEE